jgi:hypothetical protein
MGSTSVIDGARHAECALADVARHENASRFVRHEVLTIGYTQSRLTAFAACRARGTKKIGNADQSKRRINQSGESIKAEELWRKNTAKRRLK